jgi:hypothetical protein
MPEPESSSSSKRSGKLYTELDLTTGELAFLGPRGLDVLKICPSCRLDPDRVSSAFPHNGTMALLVI